MVGHLGKDDQKPNCGQIETEGEISIWKVHQELFTFTKHELDLVQLCETQKVRLYSIYGSVWVMGK